jgi:hypothetical protein
MECVSFFVDLIHKIEKFQLFLGVVGTPMR